MLLYLSFNNTFKDVYNVLGLSVIILYFDNVMKTPTLYDSKLHTSAHRATDKHTNPAVSGMLFTMDFICTLNQPRSVPAVNRSSLHSMCLYTQPSCSLSLIFQDLTDPHT